MKAYTIVTKQEPVDIADRFWGVFWKDIGKTDWCGPLALFSTEEDAKDWMTRRRGYCIYVTRLVVFKSD